MVSQRRPELLPMVGVVNVRRLHTMVPMRIRKPNPHWPSSHWMVALLVATAYGCATVPYTNRSQLLTVSEAEETQLGISAYKEVLRKEVLVHDPAVVDLVRRVGERIAKAADKPKYQWEFAVIDDDSMINAFALPGGKVAVYTGLFPVAQDEAGLAAVMGHEVAHALAHHGAERMSQGQLAQLGGVALAIGLGAAGAGGVTGDMAMQAYGLGAQVGILLPYSRAQESEADHIGLILMAKAGYNPEAALGLWQRMENLNDKAPVEFLSTHPSPGTRQQDIRRWLPEAEGYYHADPNLTIAKLPSVAELEASSDRGEAAFTRYARTINEKAHGVRGERVLTVAVAKTMEVDPVVIEQRQRESGVSLGDVAVASALSKAGAGAFDDVIVARKQGKKWSAVAKDNDQIIKDALGLLRSALVEARSLARGVRG